MTLDISNPADLRGVTVSGADGDKLGSVDEVFLDNETSKPEWVAVKTGLFGSHVSLIPLATADWNGSDLTVPFTKDQVKNAPSSDPGQEISQDDERELFTYYGISYGGDTLTATGVAGQTGETATGTTGGYEQRSDTGAQGHDTSGPNTDDAMTRSEERLHVGTETREAGRARLRKYITSETQTVTVPVSHDEVFVDREPITDANRDAALAGGDLTEEEHEIVLTEERPIVVKETVPVERVRLGTHEVTDEQTVTEEVRKENIEVEGVDGTDTSRNDRR